MNSTQPRRIAWGWAIAIAGSILLNISLFGLMPGLIQRIPATPDELEEIKHIQVIRVKKTEAPPRKKELPEPAKPKPVEKINQRHVAQVKQKLIKVTPRLAFELNTKIPVAPMDLVVPPSLEHFSMNIPTLKSSYSINELDQPLTALVKIPPLYPLRAKKRGIEGSVRVEFTVTVKGFVDQIEIIRAKPKKTFNKAVINCVSQWRFKPGTVEGIPVSTRAGTTIYFKLEE